MERLSKSRPRRHRGHRAALSEAGLVIVPREPTAAMIDAGTPELSIAENGWRAMVDAAPATGEAQARVLPFAEEDAAEPQPPEPPK